MDASAGLKAVGVAALSAYVGYALPSVTALAAVRRFTPHLAGRGRADHVALTFDDGPHPVGTPAILDILHQFRVTGTFFVLGEQVAQHPDVARRIVADGHEIGLHGWHHHNSLTMTPMALRRSVRAGLAEIAAVTGMEPRFYRPPYGIASAASFIEAHRAGLVPVLWDAWGKDWRADATPQSVVDTVCRNACGGSTILLHDSDCASALDSWRTTAAALPTLLTELRSQGLTVGPLRDHGLR
ncbi:polysaccharide deacetylase family protein [Skermania sp. ID1734]|uniref:polysaccharide deacetylase family protein n=1 Tax=Skermania sp. ID1734 TaxID=2597516 RepID=UPI001180673D|nr:polysaccharide deacetylase family protein [Skermania sp. ID1734]TSD99241.1 polysaccharide deacetylase family protein [Skermania sp. ID1734]